MFSNDSRKKEKFVVLAELISRWFNSEIQLEFIISSKCDSRNHFSKDFEKKKSGESQYKLFFSKLQGKFQSNVTQFFHLGMMFKYIIISAL